MDLQKANLKKYLFSFKFLFLILYVVLFLTVYFAILLFPNTDEMIKSCVEKAKSENETGMVVGFSCYFHPLLKYYVVINAPGFIVSTLFDKYLIPTQLLNNLPDATLSIISELKFPSEMLISATFYTLIGHVVDKIIRRIRKK